MQVPLELAFHHVDPTEWAEVEIRERIDKLEKLYGRLVSARVRIERHNNTHGVPPVVHIELGIPGRADLIVSHEPERLQRRYQTPDLRNAIHEAFRVAERQLLELKEQRHGRTKEGYHDDVNQYLGQVAEMHPADDHGFLLTKEGGLLYFHRNSLLTGDFDRLKTGDEVRYVEEVGDTGPIATKVRVKTG
ncbi:MAG: HPF/RaiA family ribosome-associated protein [Bauldia sp.]|nr:HPF/RaiA family ribosome-associated protein [Bauldia sp.]